MSLTPLINILGPSNVLTGTDCAPYAEDWVGLYHGQPRAVLRPSDTEQVAAIMRYANETGIPVVPMAGNTGLNGGTHAPDSLVLSLERMNAIRSISVPSRVAVVEAGVILQHLREAAQDQGLLFPLTFGAQGSARIGGCLATNAGGSNVLRYGNARDLCLGLEAVLPTGEVLDLMGALHKDNSGFNLPQLLIGSEGTLGVITAATLKLFPAPLAYATAMVAVSSLSAALDLLNALQEATGGGVEACEYMPGAYIPEHLARFPEARAPFAQPYETMLMIEVGTTSREMATPGENGTTPLGERLETVLGEMLESGAVLDAVVAQSQAQRREMWARREAAGEVMLMKKPVVMTDIAVPLDQLDTFLTNTNARITRLDAGAVPLWVAHLGDGNIHYSVWPSRDDGALKQAMTEIVEEETCALRGSVSAEHGVGISKLATLSRRKSPVALEAMRRIKAALDPNNILNPGKVVPGPQGRPL